MASLSQKTKSWSSRYCWTGDDRRSGNFGLQVKALEDAKAAKEKEVAVAAKRAQRVAAADRRKGEAGPSNAGGKPGLHPPGSAGLTPKKSAAQHGTNVPLAASTVLPSGVPAPAHPGAGAAENRGGEFS